MLVYQEGSLKLCGQDTLVPSICQATFGKGAPDSVVVSFGPHKRVMDSPYN